MPQSTGSQSWTRLSGRTTTIIPDLNLTRPRVIRAIGVHNTALTFEAAIWPRNGQRRGNLQGAELMPTQASVCQGWDGSAVTPDPQPLAVGCPRAGVRSPAPRAHNGTSREARAAPAKRGEPARRSHQEPGGWSGPSSCKGWGLHSRPPWSLLPVFTGFLCERVCAPQSLARLLRAGSDVITSNHENVLITSRTLA